MTYFNTKLQIFSNISEIIKIFPYFKTSRLALRPTKSSIQWIPWSFPEVKRPGRETNHCPPYSAEAKNERSYASSPPIFFYRVNMDSFTFKEHFEL
jgi:hypothetical protein